MLTCTCPWRLEAFFVAPSTLARLYPLPNVSAELGFFPHHGDGLQFFRMSQREETSAVGYSFYQPLFLVCAFRIFWQASREGVLFLIANASVLSAAAVAFVFFCAMTRLFSDSGDDR